MSGSTLEFTDANFQSEVLDSPLPVLVDFWAPWCGPCRMLTPVIEQLAKDYAGRAKVGKVDIDENAATATKYNIRGVPTLLLFNLGQVMEQHVGASPKETIVKMLDKHIIG